MTTTDSVVDLTGRRDLPQLISGIPARGLPSVVLVVAVHDAAARAGSRSWLRWAARNFDGAHERDCACRRTEAS